MTADTIPARLQATAARQPDRTAVVHRLPDGTWSPMTWQQYASAVMAAARALLALGVKPGDRVCILGYNRPEWTILDLAAMSIGAIPAGIYTTCSASEVAWILRHAEAPVVLLEDAGQLAKVEAHRDTLPDLRHVVMMRGADAPAALSWDQFLARAEAIPEARVRDAIAALRPDDDATFIYTSGTTGPPKAVRLTHDNLAFTASIGGRIVEVGPDDRLISYLPLSHIAEQIFSVHLHCTEGYTLYFAESLEKLRDNLPIARPTILFGVPRVWEKVHAGLAARLQQATGLKAALVAWARGVALRVNALADEGQAPGPWLAAQHRLARRLVFSTIKDALGLTALRFGVSGAAPIAREVLAFFASLDVRILEVYGQSEDCGPTSFNRPDRARLGSVGPPIPDVDVRIAHDGEILVRGRNVFAGYFKDPAASAETLQDGWLHSGDLGRFDGDGFLYVTGRKKDILITSGGKNITPVNIELMLKGLPMVAQAVVVGDRRPYLGALLDLDPDAARAWCREHGHPDRAPHELDALRDHLQALIDARINPELARVEHVRRVALLPRPLSQEDGDMTPTMKIKRNKVNEHFAGVIDAMYDRP